MINGHHFEPVHGWRRAVPNDDSKFSPALSPRAGSQAWKARLCDYEVVVWSSPLRLGASSIITSLRPA
jgi:hypothetical protein